MSLRAFGVSCLIELLLCAAASAQCPNGQCQRPAAVYVSPEFGIRIPLATAPATPAGTTFFAVSNEGNALYRAPDGSYWMRPKK